MTDVVFVGVTTGSSLIHQAVRLWQPLLPQPCRIRGVDLALDVPGGAYRLLLRDIAGDASTAGAVVTAHKARLFEAARSQFARLDALAVQCQEVNAVRRTPYGLLGWARDPVSVGRVVDHIWPESDGHVVCLGAGGTGLALAHHLLTSRQSGLVVCADPDPRAVQRVVRLAPDRVVAHTGDGPWDGLVAAAPPGSLVVNATGMGKDRPGSPVTDQVRFPDGSVVWELNYRGALRFLSLARLQAAGSGLAVHDGWQLFCHGWAAALTVVLDLPDDQRLGQRFAEATRSLRPTVPSDPPADPA